MPHFVLLRHECLSNDAKPSHWDLMLEQGESLATWQLRELPGSWARQLGIAEGDAAETVSAIRLPDHRLAYLDYEGPLSGGRGEVRRCDQGDYQVVKQDENGLEISLQGAVLCGSAKFAEATLHASK